MENKWKASPGWAILITGAVVMFTCGFLAALVGIDYPPHEAIVLSLDLSDPVAMFRAHPEPLWHLLVLFVMKLTHVRVEIAAGIVTGILVMLTYLIAYLAMRRRMPALYGGVIAAFCTVLGICAAIYVPWFNKEPYLGQSSPNVWHNPTTIMVRPFALLVFLLVSAEVIRCRRSEFEEGVSVPKGILIAVLLILSCLAKPSFVQIFYPGIFTLMVIWLIVYKGKNLKMALQLFVVCLPSLAVMIIQLVNSFYGGTGEGGGIAIAPFKVAGLRTSSIPISMLLVTAFPLLMAILTIIRKKMGWSEIFAWILFAWGAFWRLLLEEQGARAAHGNFTWGYVLGLYLIWFTAVRSYLELYFDDEMTGTKRGVGFVIASIVLAAHFLSGLYYLFYLVILGHNM